MNETVHRKAFKSEQFYPTQKIYIAQKKEKAFKETVSFHLASNVLSHFLYFRFTSRALTSLIMPVGITGKSGPEYWPITRYIFTSSSHIIKDSNKCKDLLNDFPHSEYVRR